jgi:hypothetical protein
LPKKIECMLQKKQNIAIPERGQFAGHDFDLRIHNRR